MTNTIRVAKLKANSMNFEIDENFEPNLENLQSAVGGNIEALTLDSVTSGREITIWLNEEGKLDGLPPNFAIVRKDSMTVADIVMGDIIITSSDSEGETVGLNDEELELVKERFDLTHGIVMHNLVVTKTVFF